MKKLILFFMLICMGIGVFAADFPSLKYHNISLNKKIFYDSDTDEWSYGKDKNTGNYFKKVKGFGNAYDYVDSNKEYAFTTGCNYEFIYNKKFICYSNSDLKFYQLSIADNSIQKTILPFEETEKLLSGYKVIKISEFSNSTHSYKIKKGIGNLKIFVFNDTDKIFPNYTFSSGNMDFDKYLLSGFVNVKSAGMLQFSGNESDTDSPWYVLLVR